MKSTWPFPRDGDHTSWVNRTRVFLQPIAPPSILGLFGFGGATFIVAAHLAGMWSFRARDGLATAMHGMWGSFWLAWGLLEILGEVGLPDLPAGAFFPEFGFWFIALAAITLSGAIAATAESVAITLVLGTLAAGAATISVALLTGSSATETVAGYVFIVSALLAWYTATAMMFEGTFGKVVLPLGKYKKAANIPGGIVVRPLEYSSGEPGVKVGQ